MPSDLEVLNNYLTYRKLLYATGGNPSGLSLYLRLFVNNFTPACTDLIGAYTECSLSGYAAIALAAGSWTDSLSACVYTGTYPAQTFTFTAGGQTIYGHYVTDGSSGVLWADLWGTPFTVPTGGGAVQVAMQFVDLQC